MRLPSILRSLLFGPRVQRLFADGPVLPVPAAPLAWVRGQRPPRNIEGIPRPVGRVVTICKERSKPAATEYCPVELLPFR